ncbi:hypothetical protein LSM04_005635 [Trypanosoma melophagium]|uniref:uncharacterized protein n=1 Tax=Trypanosoma melophagium TaxID=715481 RepID=UPI003519FF9E|nr:hypothetical protein LSM04_005635 [Trypanosoma melophagium]
MNASFSGGGIRPLSAPPRLRDVMGASTTPPDPLAGKSLLSSRWDRRNADILRDAVEYRRVAYVDDIGLMMALMQHAQPSLPPRATRPVKNAEAEQSSECQSYIKNLTRAIEEGVVRKRGPRLKSGSPREAATTVTTTTTTTNTTATMAPTSAAAAAGTGVGAGVHSVSSDTTKCDGVTSEEKGALQMWEGEQEEEKEKEEGNGQREQGTIGGGAFVCNSGRSLLNTIARGRFPMHNNASLSDVVRNWGKKEGGRGKKCVTSNDSLETHSRLLNRLKREPVRIWRVIHDISTDPPSSSPIADRQRKSYDVSEDWKIAGKWRHKFDHVIYADQIKVNDSLAVRDRCRHMVIRHETISSGQPPLTALQNTFNENRSRPFTAPCIPVKTTTGGDCVKSSVWIRRANEIALEREREYLIKVIRRFELREAAASLSKEAVESLRDDLIKLIRFWPCDYRKRHIFTKKNFVKWMRRRHNLPSTVGIVGDGTDITSLTESMESRAEAAFIEYVLTILPSSHSTQ